MNREIKFRALCNATNIFVYGLPCTVTTIGNTITHISQFFGIERKFGRENVFIKLNTVGQFTGLQDSNGVDVYEGDILEIVNSLSVLSNTSNKYLIENLYDFFNWYERNCIEGYYTIKVIGNIYANPELLSA
jgi:YopX protein